MTFHTRIYHPNVTNDSAGNICIALLKADQWKPASKLPAVLEAVQRLLVEPNPDDPLEAGIATEFRDNHAAYVKQAAEFTKRYATAPDPFHKK